MLKLYLRSFYDVLPVSAVNHRPIRFGDISWSVNERAESRCSAGDPKHDGRAVYFVSPLAVVEAFCW